MGLDQYLYKKTYIGNHYKDPKDQIKIDVEGVTQGRVSEIVERVGQWRKANQIHQWFVEHVQEGKDNCGEYYVSPMKMQELLDAVNAVLAGSKLVNGKVKNGEKLTPGSPKWIPILEKGKIVKDPSVAIKILPTTSGFFFGGTEYDQYYIQNLRETKQILENALKENGEYYYSSSW